MTVIDIDRVQLAMPPTLAKRGGPAALVGGLVLLSALARADGGCALAPGEQAVRTIRDKSFVLRRLPDDHEGRASYELRVPVVFKKHQELPAPDDFAERMARLARGCYDEAAARMIGPNGERLRLALDLGGETGLTPTEIRVFGGYAWVPFAQWTVDYNCPTIVHETMHLLGLPDVYPMPRKSYEIDGTGKWLRWVSEAEAAALPADRRKKLPRYCRPEGPVDSLLYDQYEAYRSAGLPLNKDDYLWVHKNECPRRQKDDPHPGRYLHCVTMKDAMKEPAAEPGPEALASFNALGAGRAGAAAKGSLFYPNEARALLYDADCDADAKTLLSCIANSDRTVDEGCLPSPRECSDGRFDWLSR